MNELISVVVPAYNVEKYIGRCIESLMKQLYRNMEFIIIDDGSTDRTGNICDEYQRQDSRIHVLHQKNQGVSVSRNTGIQFSRGRLITFVDGDDFVEEEYALKLHKNLVETGADVSICAMKRNYDQKRTDTEQRIIMDPDVLLRFMLLQRSYAGNACGVLYRRELWDRVSFPAGKRHAEDFYTNALIMPYIKSAVLTREALYHYVDRESSAQHEMYTPKKMEEYELILESKKIIEKKYPELEEAATTRLVSTCFHILFMMDKKVLKTTSGSVLKECIRNNRKRMVFGKDVNKKVRFACLLSYCGMNVCRWIYSLLGLKGRIDL